MKRDKFLELLGSISDTYVKEFADIEEAGGQNGENYRDEDGDRNREKNRDTDGDKKRKRRRWVRCGMAAACLALAVTAAVALPGILRDSGGGGNWWNFAGPGAGSPSGPDVGAQDSSQGVAQGSADSQTPGTASGDIQGMPGTETPSNPRDRLLAGARPMLVSVSEDVEPEVVPSVAAYIINPDLSNIENPEKFYFSEGAAKMLAENGFVVENIGVGHEFFEIYEVNRYEEVPNFVTVDSMMHTYHLYFSYLLKNIERDYLTDCITQLSGRMLEDSLSQYGRLKGSEWESAAKRNVAYFTVGAKLLDDGTVVDSSVEDIVQYELHRINKAQGIQKSEITGAEEDYTQYIPRGYYEGDADLERYFKAMMWYGRMHFTQQVEDLDRSALLMTLAMYEDPEAFGLWEAAYAVTSFFAGASDDLGVCEYAPILREVYGEDATVESLAGNEEAFARFHAMTAELSAPVINSVPIGMGEDNVILGLRFMGQRFTIDAAIMQNLVYSRVGMDLGGLGGTLRMLPDVLDVPAALGSDTALRILEETGGTEYEGYMENMEQLREGLAKENSALWSASLYAGWLDTLRPLLTVKGEGWPVFMQGEQWAKKSLECFAGSFTELKHDTVLYAEQIIAEMGGDNDGRDFRGYVEPEPLVYARFARLAGQTAEGLKGYGMLSGAQEEDLSRLRQLAEQLCTISQKELADETLSDEEYKLIEYYGGNIEHFWYEAVKDESENEGIYGGDFPAALVVDIATDPNGQVLEAATGRPSSICVAVKVDGHLRVARGSVYSFYQFAWPMDDRLTDEKWRRMMGFQVDESGFYNMEKPVEKPEWTQSYRY